MNISNIFLSYTLYTHRGSQMQQINNVTLLLNKILSTHGLQCTDSQCINYDKYHILFVLNTSSHQPNSAYISPKTEYPLPYPTGVVVKA